MAPKTSVIHQRVENAVTTGEHTLRFRPSLGNLYRLTPLCLPFCPALVLVQPNDTVFRNRIHATVLRWCDVRILTPPSTQQNWRVPRLASATCIRSASAESSGRLAGRPRESAERAPPTWCTSSSRDAAILPEKASTDRARQNRLVSAPEQDRWPTHKRTGVPPPVPWTHARPRTGPRAGRYLAVADASASSPPERADSTEIAGPVVCASGPARR